MTLIMFSTGRDLQWGFWSGLALLPAAKPIVHLELHRRFINYTSVNSSGRFSWGASLCSAGGFLPFSTAELKALFPLTQGARIFLDTCGILW